MIDNVVVMRARPVVVGVIDVIYSGVHVQLDRLHVHQRESGNQRERDQPTESSDHLFLTSYYIPVDVIRGGPSATLAVDFCAESAHSARSEVPQCAGMSC